MIVVRVRSRRKFRRSNRNDKINRNFMNISNGHLRRTQSQIIKLQLPHFFILRHPVTTYHPTLTAYMNTFWLNRERRVVAVNEGSCPSRRPSSLLALLPFFVFQFRPDGAHSPYVYGNHLGDAPTGKERDTTAVFTCRIYSGPDELPGEQREDPIHPPRIGPSFITMRVVGKDFHNASVDEYPQPH